MNQSIKVSKAISYIVMICAVLLFLAVWPGQFFQQKYVSKSNEIFAKESKPVNVEYNVSQMFVGEGGELKAIEVYVCNDMAGESIAFFLYDSAYKELYRTIYMVEENQETPGFVRIPVGYDLIKDQEYHFSVSGISADMIVGYEDRETSTSIVNGYMHYGGIQVQRYNVIARYVYNTPFVWWQIVLIGAALTLVTVGLLFVIKQLYAKKITDREIVVHKVIKTLFNPIAVIGCITLFLMIFPGRKFGTGVVNYIFYGGSIVLLLVVALYLINFKRLGSQSLINVDLCKERIAEYRLSICIAVALWYCYEYMNGLYDIHHYYATRRMLIWFLLGIVLTYSLKELFRIWNVLYLLIVGVAAYFYAKPYLGIEEEGDLYKLQAYIMVIGGFVILLLITNILRIILKKESVENKLNLPFVLFFGVLMGFMIVYRNQREWVWVLAVIFLLFYLRMWLWNRSSRVLEIAANGLILNFIYMVGYSLMHRPYHRYYFYRYGLGFHTVTVTGVYLALVLSALMVRFLLKYHKTQKLRDAWLELTLLSIGNVYLLMTLSRTGYLAAVVMELFMIAAFAFKTEKNKWKVLAKNYGAVVLAACVAFPIVFTLTRIVPAIVNDPILTDVEKLGAEIEKGTPSDSELYMDIERFLEVAGLKMMSSYQEARLYLNPDEVFVVNDDILLASNEEEIEDVNSLDDISNGRIAIFKEYIANWNLTGHEEMFLTRENGEIIVHAHNVYLQVIHDYGMITGVLFILFGITSFVLAIIRFVKGKEIYSALTLAIVMTFAVSGITEWNFHLCNPYGISLFMAVTPLLFKSKDIKKNEQKK